MQRLQRDCAAAGCGSAEGEYCATQEDCLLAALWLATGCVQDQHTVLQCLVNCCERECRGGSTQYRSKYSEGGEGWGVGSGQQLGECDGLLVARDTLGLPPALLGCLLQSHWPPDPLLSPPLVPFPFPLSTVPDIHHLPFVLLVGVWASPAPPPPSSPPLPHAICFVCMLLLCLSLPVCPPLSLCLSHSLTHTHTHSHTRRGAPVLAWDDFVQSASFFLCRLSYLRSFARVVFISERGIKEKCSGFQFLAARRILLPWCYFGPNLDPVREVGVLFPRDGHVTRQGDRGGDGLLSILSGRDCQGNSLRPGVVCSCYLPYCSSRQACPCKLVIDPLFFQWCPPPPPLPPPRQSSWFPMVACRLTHISVGGKISKYFGIKPVVIGTVNVTTVFGCFEYQIPVKWHL